MNLDFLRSASRTRVNAIVLRATLLTPKMRRLVLGGPELAAWLESVDAHSAAAWIKVFPPGRSGRAYTIRRVDEQARTLDIDFVLHGDDRDDGSVSAWARTVQCGDQVDIAGPRDGGFTLQRDTKWVWLAADASALPAAQSILERLPHGLPVTALLVVDDEQERQLIRSPARMHVQWRYRRTPPLAMTADDPIRTEHPRAADGPGQVWMAGEAVWVKQWRSYWLEREHVDPQRVACKGYWKPGAQDHRD
ncbi:siderophore-interacting protein [Pandoraea sp. ISTKB]|uniref:siderophore-interacting protein n=1 Tax=Pandoraea sp. ISTKB TaxID=1586708 RepID=UPI000847308F|nr:siderophore-interacting protein [Pandoraea sp. ISTKB]ODP35408.1 hypothetical protein A9762_10645 [Pandoraea sp. ISTKB]